MEFGVGIIKNMSGRFALGVWGNGFRYPYLLIYCSLSKQT